VGETNHLVLTLSKISLSSFGLYTRMNITASIVFAALHKELDPARRDHTLWYFTPLSKMASKKPSK
jgi:hypothetical protein